MKNENVKIGMKVVPFQKTKVLTDTFTTSLTMKRMKKYAVVTSWIDDESCWLLKADADDFGGDCFNACDFEPYEEKPRQVTSDFVPRPPVIIRESYNGAFTLEIVDKGKTYAYGTLEKVYEKLSELFVEDIWGLKDN